MAEFKERLKEVRLKRGLTQAQLAKIIGSQSSEISKLELGKVKPTYKTALKLVHALDVSYDYLFGRDDLSYYSEDEDVVKCLEYARDNPNIRMLFSVAKDATKEDIETTIAIVKALKANTGNTEEQKDQ